MIEDLTRNAKWLEQFENDWGAEWLLMHRVDMKNSEAQRRSNSMIERRGKLAETLFTDSNGKDLRL